MNASDVVKNKQNKVLYQAYYRPTVFQSTLGSTLYAISSISGGSTQYGSTVKTVYNSVCKPTFMTYEMQKEVEQGRVLCDPNCPPSVEQWKATNATTYKAYRPAYSTLSTVSTVAMTSASIYTAPFPFISGC